MSRWSDFPYSPRRWPFFYGWFILVMGTLGVLFSAPGQTIGFTAFTEPLLQTLQIDRSSLTLAYMVGTGASALLLTPAGRLYDKLGARTLGTIICIAMGLVLIYLSFVDRVVEALTLLGVGRWPAAFVSILVGFWMVRFCGQGVLTLISRNMVMKWFDHHRGLANGIMAVFVALGFSGAPPLMYLLQDWGGWRGAWQIMAGMIGLLFAAVVWLTWRDNPEQCGLTPDGASEQLTADRNKNKPHRRQFTLAEAIRTYPFWVFSVALAMFGLYTTALTFNLEDVFKQSGMDKATASAIFMLATPISIPLSLLGGWVADHIPLKYLLTLMVMGLIVSMVGMSFLQPGAAYWAIIVGNGISGGLFGVLMSFTWPRYYGRDHLGAISGLSMALVVLGSAVGPFLFSKANDITGTYAVAGLVCLSVSLAVLAGSFFANDPHRQPAD